MSDVVGSFLAATIRTAVPLALAALGELVVERAGVINIGLEGAILAGAFGALVGASVGGVSAGFAAAMLAGLLIAALFALPFRANVPVAALTTFITNPLTTPFLWFLAYRIGAWVLHSDAPAIVQPVAEATDWLHRVTGALGWLWDKGPAFALGLVILTSVSAGLGYALSAFGWRLWIAAKWKRRHGRD